MADGGNVCEAYLNSVWWCLWYSAKHFTTTKRITLNRSKINCIKPHCILAPVPACSAPSCCHLSPSPSLLQGVQRPSLQPVALPPELTTPPDRQKRRFYKDIEDAKKKFWLFGIYSLLFGLHGFSWKKIVCLYFTMRACFRLFKSALLGAGGAV